MDAALLATLGQISVIGFILFLIIGIISLIRKKGKKSLKWFGFMLGFLVMVIILVSVSPAPEQYLYEDNATGESGQTDSVEEDTIELDSNSFDILLKTSDYNFEENSLHVEYQTGLPDGTVVEIASFSPSFPDSWGEQYKLFFEYNQRLLQEKIETTVKDGLISITFDNNDFNGLLFPNSILYTTININSTDENNSFIKEKYYTADKFNEATSDINGKMKENEKEIFALDNDNGLEIKFFDKYEVKNAHSIDDIFAYYKTESISYKELEKNPLKYEGTPISFTGEILQIQTDEVDNPDNFMLDNYSVIRLAVGGDLDQVVFVTVQDANGMEGIVSDDTITVYGEMTGSKTYESVAGYEITIPSMEAVIYEQ